MGAVSAPVKLWRRLLAELLGSAFLAAVVIGSGIAAQRLSPGQTGLELLENAAATEPDVRPAGGQHLHQGPRHPGPLPVRDRRHPRADTGDLRTGPVGTAPGCPGGGGRLYRRSVFLHLLHQLRQPRDHHRPDVSGTFAGIAPSSAPAFIAAQIIGGLLALVAIKALYPAITPAQAAQIVVPHQQDQARSGRRRSSATTS
jgi:hypothetical protein